MSRTVRNYYPDSWVILEIKGDDPHYRVLGGWSGGYLHGDSWRLNSGITRHEFDGDYWYFYGSSGSCYLCYLDSYGLRKSTIGVWKTLKEKYNGKIEIVKDQEWVSKDWDWILKDD